MAMHHGGKGRGSEGAPGNRRKVQVDKGPYVTGERQRRRKCGKGAKKGNDLKNPKAKNLES